MTVKTKAANYIDQLDNARCTGNWQAVPELIRKIRKHAPDRSCTIVLTRNLDLKARLDAD
jgi:cargo-transport protein YPP1